MVSEEWLGTAIQQRTVALRASLPAGELPVLLARDLAESMQLAAPTPSTSPNDEMLPGRQSGSAAWRSARGEMGTGTAVAGTVVGGKAGRVVCSGEHAGAFEEAVNLFDGSDSTKVCVV